MGSAKEQVTGAPQMVASATEGNPLAVGLIAFGAGLLAASLLPATEKEHRVVTEQVKPRLDEARSEAQGVAQEAAEHLKPTVTDAANQVRDQAQGAAQTVADEAGSAKDQVRSDATQAADDVREAERAAPEASGRSGPGPGDRAPVPRPARSGRGLPVAPVASGGPDGVTPPGRPPHPNGPTRPWRTPPGG